jgi:hypothetical protein
MTSQKNHIKKVYRTRPGVSLLISLILVSILVVFGIGVSNLVISSIRESANVNQANQAYYAAEGGMEMGLLENKSKDAGYDATLADVDYNGTGGKPGEPGVLLSKVTIQGKVPESSQIGGEYVMPRPGTGTAGTGCDVLNPPVDIDDACNWNKIKVGETVGIPLYTTNADGSINNPADIDLQTLKVKLRTPCKDGSNTCSGSVRYLLNAFEGDSKTVCNTDASAGVVRNYYCGDTIASWQIIGTNKKGDLTYNMEQWPDYDSLLLQNRTLDNTELYAWIINDAKNPGGLNSGLTSFNCGNFCILDQNRVGIIPSSGIYGPILDFLNNSSSGYFPRAGLDVINKPIMKLSIIHALNEFPSGTVPYLEYQFTSDVSALGSSPADLTQTITSEGFSGPFKQVLEVKLPQETGLLEYVIQQ